MCRTVVAGLKSLATILAFGKIESCSKCHASFERTDFVSREDLVEAGKHQAGDFKRLTLTRFRV
jgi:hypothetical protein